MLSLAQLSPSLFFIFNTVNLTVVFLKGWNGSADPRKRQFEVKKGENEDMKREMTEIEKKRSMEHQDMTSDVSSSQLSFLHEWRHCSQSQ